MLRICAWCQKELGSTGTGDDQFKTHTICPDCMTNLEFQDGVPLERYLDTLSAPVVVVGEDSRMVYANPQARAMLEKPLPHIIGQLGGDVFECAYARLPNGCGRTIHCSGCIIRRTVMDTFTTGQSHIRIPAILRQDDPDMPTATHLLITTFLANSTVLLQIEPAHEVVEELSAP